MSNFGDTQDKFTPKDTRKQKNKVRITSRGTDVSHKDQISRHNSNKTSLPTLEFGKQDSSIRGEMDRPSILQEAKKATMPKGIISPTKKFGAMIKGDHGLRSSFYNTGEIGSLRRLPLTGETDPTKPGYSSFEWHSKSTESISAAKRALATFQYWVGGSICACRLTMTDGSRSPKFGKFHPLDRAVHLTPNDQVKHIVMRGDSEYV